MIQRDAGVERRLTDLRSELAASIERWRALRDGPEPPPSPQSQPAAGPELRAPSRPAAPHQSGTPSEAVASLLRLVDRDWSQLRERHEDALNELRQHAHTLGRVTVAAATSSIDAIQIAEARLVEIAQSLGAQIDGLSRQIDSAVSELRALREAALARESGPTEAAAPCAAAAAPAHSIAVRVAMGMAALAILAGGVGAWRVWTGARAALALAADSQRQVEAALAQARQDLEASRAEAGRQLDRVRESSQRTEAIASVLAAPDLVRYAVAGPGDSPTSGQVLWSRSRGVVLSVSRVPPAPPGMTYQLWLQTTRGAVDCGRVSPDGTGGMTMAIPPPSSIAPVIGAALTIEPEGGSAEPSDRVLAQSAPRPAT